MPRAARDLKYKESFGYQRPYPAIVTPVRPKLKPVLPAKKTQKKKINFFSKVFSLILLVLVGIYPIPYTYHRISKPLLFGVPYPEVRVNLNQFIHPTRDYLSNSLFLNTRLLVGANIKNPEMTKLYTTEKMQVLELRLRNLMSEFKAIEPAIFVWDYDSGKYVDIQGSKPYPAASIIKIPVLIRLFKSIEANQLTIYDEMLLTPYYKADGSGDLKRKPSNSRYTIDELAKVMIQKSDNSATNMIISAVGGMTDINSGIRNWGLKSTYVNNWLPDLVGTNYTTARDLATILYNLDNPGFLSLNSREYIVDYMSHVENNRLIQAGLAPNALFVHKTGDIGKMLGDAGIVFAPNGKKYIVVILANRPYNSPQGKNFIQKASNIIYNIMVAGGY